MNTNLMRSASYATPLYTRSLSAAAQRYLGQASNPSGLQAAAARSAPEERPLALIQALQEAARRSGADASISLASVSNGLEGLQESANQVRHLTRLVAQRFESASAWAVVVGAAAAYHAVLALGIWAATLGSVTLLAALALPHGVAITCAVGCLGIGLLLAAVVRAVRDLQQRILGRNVHHQG
jgi:hypothetical protein